MFDDYAQWDYGEGICYYDTFTHRLFCVENRPVSTWFDVLALILPCPFCAATVGASEPSDVPDVKRWMGVHLARHHETEVDEYLIAKEYDEINHTNTRLKVATY